MIPALGRALRPPAWRRRSSGYGDAPAPVNARLWRLAWLCGLALLLAPAWIAPASAAPLKILAFGDSLTAGLGLPAEESFAAQLEAALRAKDIEAQVINGGVSGDTTAGGVARLDWALADKPDLVILELGANDALRGLDPAQAESNLDWMLTRLADAKVPVLLAGMLAPRNMGEDYIDAFDAIYPRLAQAHGVPLYPFFLEGVAGDAALNQPDMLHPNRDGVAAIVAGILPHVIALIEKVRDAAPS